MNLELNISEKPDNVFLLLRKSLIIDGVPCSVRKLSALMQEKLGYCVYYSNISDIENGKKEPSLRALCIYHEFFNVPFEYTFDIYFCKAKSNAAGFTTTTSKSSSSSFPGK